MTEVNLCEWTFGNNVSIESTLPVDVLRELIKKTGYHVKDGERSEYPVVECWECKLNWGKDWHNVPKNCPICGKKLRSATWNGWTTLLKQSQAGLWYFPKGLALDVIDVLRAKDYTVKYHGRSKPFRCVELAWRGPELREYQQEAYDRVMAGVRDGLGGIICIPTRGGKSLIMAKMIHELGVSTLITVHTRELLNQWADVLKENLGITPAIYGGGKKAVGNITIGMIQAIHKNLKSFPIRAFGMYIADECHLYSAKTFNAVAMKCPAYYRVGASATPTREDGAMLKFVGGLGRVYNVVSVPELVEQGFLARPEVVWVEVPGQSYRGYSWQDAYREGIVENDARNQLIVGRAEEYAYKQKKQVYVHVKQIAHGELLASRIIGATFLSSKDNSKIRELELAKFKSGERRILVSTLLGIGVDIPSMDVIIMACGGKSETGTLQVAGRVLTQRDGKRKAIIVDFLDQGDYLRDHAQQRMVTYQKTFGE